MTREAHQQRAMLSAAVRDLATLLDHIANAIDGRDRADLDALAGRLEGLGQIDGAGVFAALVDRQGLGPAIALADRLHDKLSDAGERLMGLAEVVGEAPSRVSGADLDERSMHSIEELDMLDASVAKLRAHGVDVEAAGLLAAMTVDPMLACQRRLAVLRRERDQIVAKYDRDWAAYEAKRQRDWLEHCASQVTGAGP